MIFLNREQVDKILDEIRNVGIIKSIVPEAQRKATESLLEKIGLQLRLYPIKENKIKKIAKEIIKQLTFIIHPDGSVSNMRIQPGSFVGVSATEAMCQPVTQLTMKTSHNAGSAMTVSQSNQAIKEVLTASKNRKQVWCRIYFNSYLTFDEVYEKIPDIVSTTLKNVIHNHQIMFYSSENTFWWHRFRKTPPVENSIFVRLNLITEMLYERKIEISEISNIIKEVLPKCRIIYGPKLSGIIDIIPDTDMVTEKFTESNMNEVMMYINTQIISIFDKINLKGISYIQKLIPIRNNVLGAAILDETKISEDSWLISLSVKGMIQFGISKERIVKIFELFGFSVTEEKHLLILSGKEVKETPTKDVKAFIQLQPEDSEISRLGILLIAETQGTNLREILLLPGVDTTMTISNDFNELIEIYGIEATRNQMMKELNDLIKSTAEINGRHLILMGDLMTSIGDITPINYNGVIKQQRGIMAKVAYERGFATLSSSAGLGAVDSYLDKNLINITPTATSILTGQMFPVVKNIKASPIDTLKKLLELKNSGLKLTERARDIIDQENENKFLIKENEKEEEFQVENINSADTETMDAEINLASMIKKENIVTLTPIEADSINFYMKMWKARERTFESFTD